MIRTFTLLFEVADDATADDIGDIGIQIEDVMVATFPDGYLDVVWHHLA